MSTNWTTPPQALMPSPLFVPPDLLRLCESSALAGSLNPSPIAEQDAQEAGCLHESIAPSQRAAPTERIRAFPTKDALLPWSSWEALSSCELGISLPVELVTIIAELASSWCPGFTTAVTASGFEWIPDVGVTLGALPDPRAILQWVSRVIQVPKRSRPMRRLGRAESLSMIVLCPTRGSAETTRNGLVEALTLVRTSSPVAVVAAYGGTPFDTQRELLTTKGETFSTIIVATPGRLWDLIKAETVKCSTVHALVLSDLQTAFAVGFRETVIDICISLRVESFISSAILGYPGESPVDAPSAERDRAPFDDLMDEVFKSEDYEHSLWVQQ